VKRKLTIFLKNTLPIVLNQIRALLYFFKTIINPGRKVSEMLKMVAIRRRMQFK
jgi:hypothetical protein